MDVLRARRILERLSWHGDGLRLLQEEGVDEGELARAAEVAVAFVDAHLPPPTATPSPPRV